ncbi:MAG: DNA polymerase I [Oscillochloridaceae bacterium umkhey_bin13]
MSQRKRLALVDGHALAFRAFFALREAGLRTSSGEPTYAVFGFAQILLTMLQEQQPAYVAVAFDVGRTFRDDLYAEYKAGRAETPAEFYPQLERMKQLIGLLGIPIYTAEGFEADDVIGTLARQATDLDVATLILTGDTDALQLVNDHVRVILANPYAKGNKTTTLYDEAAVHERYAGLVPSQLADLRGLKGDSSDNIPGVRGIGDKGAITLLKQFGSVEQLFDQLEQAPKRYQKVLEGQREAAEFSKRLATIVRDAPVQLDLSSCALGTYDRAGVIRLFQELEIGASSNLIKKLPPLPSEAVSPTSSAASSQLVQQDLFGEALPASLADPSPPPTPAAPLASGQLGLFDEAPADPAAPTVSGLGRYVAITEPDQLAHLVAALHAAPGFAFDTEATGLRPLDSHLVGIALAHTPGEAAYIPLAHRDGTQLDQAQVIAALRPLFEDAARPKYAHNAKFDLAMLQGVGLQVRGLTFDTMLAAALLGKRAGLKDLAAYELGLLGQITPIEDLIGRGSKQISFDQVPIAQATPYAAADADLTLRLVQTLEPLLHANERLTALFQRLELPLIEVLVTMEQAGITLDRDYLGTLGTRLNERIAEREAAIYEYAGGRFNINSGDQLSDVLFERLGISSEGVGRTAKTKKYSITAETLEQLHDRHPIFGLILHYRQLSKLKSTYIDALPGLISPQTGRIHTIYNQVGAATGRLSSNDPNLQNIPVRTEEGRAIRRAFVAEPGKQFIAADYSQVELRVLAHYTRDPALLATFNEGRDIHAATAARLFGVPEAEVDKQQRRIAKTVVFGIVYGISAFGLSQRLGLDRSTAQALIDGVFQSFPGIKAYLDATLEQARTQGYVNTLFGRRRQFPELMSGDKGPRAQAAMREAINAPIQGTAADLMKIAMLNVHRALQNQGLATQLLLQVHDELILEAPEAEVPAAVTLVRSAMEGAYPALAVRLAVEVETGPNWDELTPYAATSG